VSTVTRLSLTEQQIARPRTADTVSLHRWVQTKRADLMDDLAGIEVTPQVDRALTALVWCVVALFSMFAAVGAWTVGHWMAGGGL
jgi:hypothetical protein